MGYTIYVELGKVADIVYWASENFQLEPPNLIKEHPKKNPADVFIHQKKHHNNTYSHSELEGTAINMLMVNTPPLDTKGTQQQKLLSHL